MGHGGHRDGSGRKKGGGNKAQAVAKDMAAGILDGVDLPALWNSLLQSEDPRIKLETLRYLCDRRWGKPAQALSLSSSDVEPFKIEVTYVGG
jgi:hypothetical protein